MTWTVTMSAYLLSIDPQILISHRAFPMNDIQELVSRSILDFCEELEQLILNLCVLLVGRVRIYCHRDVEVERR